MESHIDCGCPHLESAVRDRIAMHFKVCSQFPHLQNCIEMQSNDRKPPAFRCTPERSKRMNTILQQHGSIANFSLQPSLLKALISIFPAQGLVKLDISMSIFGAMKDVPELVPTLGTCRTASVEELAAHAMLTAFPLASSRQLVVDSTPSVAKRAYSLCSGHSTLQNFPSGLTATSPRPA